MDWSRPCRGISHDSKVGEAPRQDEVVVAGSAETYARLREGGCVCGEREDYEGILVFGLTVIRVKRYLG